MTKKEFLSLKMGDWVVCNTSSYPWDNKRASYRRGLLYQLRETPREGEYYIRTVTDNRGSETNGWNYKYFDITPEHLNIEDFM